jgi:hypothetical protein
MAKNRPIGGRNRDPPRLHRMQGQVILAATATLVALAFALSTLERWSANRQHHELAWTISLFMFSLASAALWLGASIGWDEPTFKAFYLFGAIMNVPFLAVGTVYLLAGGRIGDRTFAGVALVMVFCAGWVLATPLLEAVPVDELPRGKEVFGPIPRIMAAVASGLGATVLIVGAIWSAVRLLASTRSPRSATTNTGISPSRLAGANALIASGTVVLSAGGLMNAAVGEMEAFSLSLVIGISLIFGGFLVTNPTARQDGNGLPDWLQDAFTSPGSTSATSAAEESTIVPHPDDYARLSGPTTN